MVISSQKNFSKSSIKIKAIQLHSLVASTPNLDDFNDGFPNSEFGSPDDFADFDTDTSGAIYGCTLPFATNYNPNATVDDSSCIIDPDEYPMGDINFSGAVDVLDVILLVNIALGTMIPENIYQEQQADVTNSGNIDILDIVTMVNLILS